MRTTTVMLEPLSVPPDEPDAVVVDALLPVLLWCIPRAASVPPGIGGLDEGTLVPPISSSLLARVAASSSERVVVRTATVFESVPVST